MCDFRRWPGGRLASGAAALTVTLAWASPALGATFCVKAPGCAGTGEPSVQQALAAAGSSSGHDVIRVGPGNFNGPFTDDFGNSVTLRGAGDQTVFQDPAGSTSGSPTSTLAVTDPGSSVSSLVVVVPPGASGTGVSPELGRIDHVLVRDVASDTNDVGVAMNRGSVSHSRIVLAGTADSGGTPEGIVANGFIQDDLVHMLSPGAVGIEVSTFDAALQARQVTLVGPGDTATGAGDSASRALDLEPFGVVGSSSSTATLDGVIIRGFAHALVADGAQSPDPTCSGSPSCSPFDDVATINVSYSDFDPSHDFKGTADSAINQGAGNLNVNPGFENPAAGNYALHRGSAVIDHGDPAVPRTATPADSTTDLAGHPRKSDGNGNHVAVVDIGAYEYINHIPVAAISGPASGLAGHAVRFRGSSSHDSDGDPLRFLWSFGDGNQSSAANPRHTYSARGKYTVKLVVTDVLGAHSRPAVTQIRVSRAG